MANTMSRRSFVGGLATAIAAPAAPSQGAAAGSILNYNPNMEYRRLGKTGLMVSAVCMGGHWKRVGAVLRRPFQGVGASPEDTENIKAADFLQNRSAVLGRCLDIGMNYIDACSPQEILAYSKVLRGRRQKIYFGYSWHLREPRYKEWRSSKKLLEGLDAGLREAGLDYIDLWRISLPMEGIPDLWELQAVEEATVEGLERAKRQGKVRFTGVSSHNREWLRSVIDQYPKQIEVVLFPYTAASKTLPDESLFDSIKRQDVGVFGIKPFADNALFLGDASPNGPHAAEDSRRARAAIRYILGNPAITAPIPGLVSTAQVDNIAEAIAERRALDLAPQKSPRRKAKEKAEWDAIGREMWARVSPDHQWLRNWEYV